MVPLTFHYRSQPSGGRRIALFPGAWNPPTVAHVAMACAAFDYVDETVFLLPRALPHKSFEGASFEQRLDLLSRIAAVQPGLSVASCQRGLYFEMAEEAEAALPPGTRISLLCGKDAAERIASWNYGKTGVFDDMVDRYRLLVAERAGEYLPHARHAGRVVRVSMGAAFDDVSSTELRRRIAAREPWRHLAPPEIAESLPLIYTSPEIIFHTP